ncbi:MAG: hypothetical protein LBD33_02505 [Puniceicoccales bacterium]|jgi:hypothetical protein|nr:hypothetical protein [Puniceicoccales bacterium]
MKSVFSRIAKLIVISFLISSLLHSAPELTSSGPARGLYVPIFDEDGVKIWEITSLTGEIQGDDSIAVSNVSIGRCGENGGVVFTIESGHATVVPSSKYVRGGGVATVSGDNFAATASDWVFSGEERKFTANRDVKVVFGENIVAELVAP